MLSPKEWKVTCSVESQAMQSIEKLSSRKSLIIYPKDSAIVNFLLHFRMIRPLPTSTKRLTQLWMLWAPPKCQKTRLMAMRMIISVSPLMVSSTLHMVVKVTVSEVHRHPIDRLWSGLSKRGMTVRDISRVDQSGWYITLFHNHR